MRRLFLACMCLFWAAGAHAQAIAPADRAQIESLIRRIYATFAQQDLDKTWNKSIGEAAIFAPDMLAMIREYRDATIGEVAEPGADVFCDCQDWEKLSVVSIVLARAPVPAGAVKADVIFRDWGETRRKTITLVRTPQGWRIRDLTIPNRGSYRALIGTAMAQLRKERQAPAPGTPVAYAPNYDKIDGIWGDGIDLLVLPNAKPGCGFVLGPAGNQSCADAAADDLPWLERGAPVPVVLWNVEGLQAGDFVRFAFPRGSALVQRAPGRLTVVKRIGYKATRDCPPGSADGFRIGAVDHGRLSARRMICGPVTEVAGGTTHFRTPLLDCTGKRFPAERRALKAGTDCLHVVPLSGAPFVKLAIRVHSDPMDCGRLGCVTDLMGQTAAGTWTDLAPPGLIMNSFADGDAGVSVAFRPGDPMPVVILDQGLIDEPQAVLHQNFVFDKATRRYAWGRLGTFKD